MKFTNVGAGVGAGAGAGVGAGAGEVCNVQCAVSSVLPVTGKDLIF